MKILVWIGAFLVGLATFTASALSIVDYALNKPQVIEAMFGPMLATYRAYLVNPALNAIATTDTEAARASLEIWIDVALVVAMALLNLMILRMLPSRYNPLRLLSELVRTVVR